ncbi:MAG: exodeoxyribonuclease VII small subunit [Verrucomicrobia bacterium]|nr:exodeoxyribonuclease VII small subunit [Verrucomicrobiota bacterium]
MPTKTEKNPPTLETAMQRVSEIVSSMESGDMPLEKLIESYEEGTALVKMCQEKLDAAEKRIQIIARNARGEVSLEDFDAEAN